MNSQTKSKLRPLLLFVALLFALGALTGQIFAQRMPEAAHGPSVASQAPLLGKPGDYVGWQTCAGCHRAEAQAFAKTPHAPSEVLPTSPATPTPGMSASAAAGKKIYDDMMCAGCHIDWRPRWRGRPPSRRCRGASHACGIARPDDQAPRRHHYAHVATRHVERSNQQSRGLLDDPERTDGGQGPSPRPLRRPPALPDVRPATAPAKPMRRPNRPRGVTLPSKWRAPS